MAADSHVCHAVWYPNDLHSLWWLGLPSIGAPLASLWRWCVLKRMPSLAHCELCMAHVCVTCPVNRSHRCRLCPRPCYVFWKLTVRCCQL